MGNNNIPMWLLTELTYKCPLQCPYCSNPLNLGKGRAELTTEDWFRVMTQARELGALQIGFSGGEPLLRPDIVPIVKKASELGYYTNLITSGVVGDKKLFQELKDAGLDHIQVSFESKRQSTDQLITGSKTSYEKRVRNIKIARDLGFPTVFNCVIHKQNIDEIEEIIDFANELGVECVELANTQYYGWALKNITSLMPTKEQLENAEMITKKCRNKYPKMDIIFVIPDYYETRPKPCMNGLGSIFLTISPNGDALPCHSASVLPIKFPNVKDFSIKEIWQESKEFGHFRGFDWMKEPCRSCPEKEKDFGGCRCQAYLITGDMYNADPVCDKSSFHDKILNATKIGHNSNKNNTSKMVYRNFKNVKP